MAADAELPAVSLDFGGAAWDDRELVNAYDAALLEFHVSWSWGGHPESRRPEGRGRRSLPLPCPRRRDWR